MGPFQEYEEQKSPEKGSPRSRIPRLVLHPLQPKDKASPQSDSPFSEEEGGKECDISSDNSKRTVSTNSFCSGSERSAHGSPVLPERKAKVKRVRVMTEWSGEARSTQRHKRELRSAMKARGSEADFSSSSSTGSLKTRDSLVPNSAGKKASSRSRGVHIRPLPVFKPPGSPTANRDADLYAPHKTPPRAALSTTNSSSCNSSPTSRETEIEELKGQLSRMREDWIEEECHRVEAQLSLKEARKEIKQLRQVVETMKSSLMEKDKGIQKYFIDINIQNRKLESLLHSMELAQSGSSLQDENPLDFMCDSSDGSGRKVLRIEEGGIELGDQGAEALADSGLLVNDEMANRADIFEQVFMSTAVDFSQDSSNNPGAAGESGVLSEEQMASASTAPLSPKTLFSTSPCQQNTEDKGIQTELVPVSPDLQALLLQLLKFRGCSQGDAVLSPSTLLSFPNLHNSTTACQSDSTHPQPIMAPESSEPTDSECCPEATKNLRFMKELDFEASEEEPCSSQEVGVVRKRYWSNSFWVDLVAVAAPVLPTVAWLYSRHGVDGRAPVYNIAALIRGCCIVGLHSLRHAASRSDA
uniref:Syntabulin (syntaxin-interacting) n=1 Tax=Oryzias sinensis TaxID=183150 RepID=A0A8C7XGX4_9TELE